MNYSNIIKELKTHPENIEALSPREFEELVGELLRNLGWQVRITSPTRDGGYDIFATSKDLVGIETSWVVEVKKYRTKISIQHIRELYGIKTYLNVSQALFVTSSDFTLEAKEFEKSRYDLTLANRSKVFEWINLYKPLGAIKSNVEDVAFYSCFISYSHQDEEFAKKLNSVLREHKIKVWYAPEDLLAGKKIHEEIDKAIHIFDKLLIVLSENSMQSEWVKTEIRKARKREIKEGVRVLFPISIIDFKRLQQWELFDSDTGKDLAIELREYLIPDFSEWRNSSAFKKSFKKLLAGLEHGEYKKKKPSAPKPIKLDKEEYDWYDEIGYADYSELGMGVRVLYEEQALFPELDEDYYKRLRKIKIPSTVFRTSGRGFIKIDKSDDFWIDPRNRDRRIYESTITNVTLDGEIEFNALGPTISRRCIVDII